MVSLLGQTRFGQGVDRWAQARRRGNGTHVIYSSAEWWSTSGLKSQFARCDAACHKLTEFMTGSFIGK